MNSKQGCAWCVKQTKKTTPKFYAKEIEFCVLYKLKHLHVFAYFAYSTLLLPFLGNCKELCRNRSSALRSLKILYRSPFGPWDFTENWKLALAAVKVWSQSHDAALLIELVINGWLKGDQCFRVSEHLHFQFRRTFLSTGFLLSAYSLFLQLLIKIIYKAFPKGWMNRKPGQKQTNLPRVISEMCWLIARKNLLLSLIPDPHPCYVSMFGSRLPAWNVWFDPSHCSWPWHTKHWCGERPGCGRDIRMLWLCKWAVFMINLTQRWVCLSPLHFAGCTMAQLCATIFNS